ncbi:MAG: methyltransferase [Gemmatimonadota bacterium]
MEDRGAASANASVTDDITRLWEKLDLITPMAIRVAASLRVADLIAEGHGHLSELADRAGAHPDALGRLLRHLTARGVFEEPEPERFALNDLAAVLLDDHPTATRRWLDLEGFGGRMDLAFFDLLATVRDGRPPRGGHKTDLPAEIQASYDDVMESQSRAQAPVLVAAYDWEDARHVVDLGGGTGTFLIELLESRPEMRATLVEFPETAERARRVVEEAGLSERCEVIAGDLFEVTPEGGDVYVLKFVLHSLDDDRAEEALRRCRRAGGGNGRVLVIEHTVEPGEDRSDFTAMDMRMLILGHGRERTVDEYAALAGKAGLRLSSAIPTTTGTTHLIELRPGAD